MVGVLVTYESNLFCSGQIKINNEIIKLSEHDYLQYFFNINNKKYDLIEKSIKYNNENIGSLKLLFNKIKK